MNKTSTVLLVSAAVVVGLVISLFAFAAVTPYGHMLFFVPWWGHMTDSGHMMGDYETPGYYYPVSGSNQYRYPHTGYWNAPGGPHMMAASYTTGGYGPMHGPGVTGDPYTG